jgi:hypothetical protein
MLTSNYDQAANVAFDIASVGLSIAAIAVGAPVLGSIALLGGAILLLADTAIYAYDISGDYQGAEAVKEKTLPLRIVATIATLPDAGWNGVKAIRELNEIIQLRKIDGATAVAAGAMASRIANSGRAEKAAQIAEKANLRAQLRNEQIRGLWLHELTPRAAGLAGAALLLKEVFGPDDSTQQACHDNIQICCTGLYR